MLTEQIETNVIEYIRNVYRSETIHLIINQ